MANILVTGGAGYVGSICATQLLNAGHSVEVIDDLSKGHADAVPQGATFHRMDVGDRRALAELLKSRRFDAVFHFAAKAVVPESVADPGIYFDTNVGASVAMLEMLRAAGIRSFVFSSTAAVYGHPRTTPISEDHPTEPVNAYGESKLMFERALRWYARSYGWSVYAFRYFNACGAIPGRGERHDPETHILPLLLQTASGRRDCFNIYGEDYDTPDGTCIRDYVHVLDIADAHLLAIGRMERPGFAVYNIGTGTSYSVKQVVRAVEEVTGRKLNVRSAARREGDPAILSASPERLKREFGWAPRHSALRSIIESAWEWEQQAPRPLSSSVR